MERFAERSHRLRIAGALLAAVLVSLAVVKGVAAVRPRVENPHGKFREECSMCHSADTWKIAKVKSSFDHSKYGFRLAGAHAAGGCMSCHTSLEFSQSKTQCASCHQDPHRGELGLDCARCHGDRSFIDRGPMVRQHQLTRFPLTGGHAALDCESCHRPAAQGQMQFVGTQAQCQGCHMAQYQSAKSPDHVAAAYPLECQSCHSTISWSGAKFNHDSTGFPLTGAHRTTACVECHVNNRYAGTPRACDACHMTQYNAATPNHLASGFAASACASCHNTTQWAGAVFDHNTTAFPLTGAHQTVTCQNCHADGVYAGKPTACFSCHSTDYSSATPTHDNTSFPSSQCASCHSTTAWSPATFNHSATAFPLTGAHVTTPCAGCHGDGVYAGKTTACSGCHMTQYSSASPDHVAANFPASACASCHNTTQWAGATFDHDGPWFPIYSGRHNGTWNACSDCHTNASNYAVFTCLSCHPHDDKAGTDGHHSGVRNYQYTSNACYSCHPRGNAG
jgi:hypothetical protein